MFTGGEGDTQLRDPLSPVPGNPEPPRRLRKIDTAYSAAKLKAKPLTGDVC